MLNRGYIMLFLILVLIKTLPAQQSARDTTVCQIYDLCCSNDPTPSGVMISHVHQKNEWMLSYRFMRMNMDGILNGSNAMSDNEVFNSYTAVPKTMQMNMHMLMVMYGLTNKITLMGMFNYNSNYMKMSMKMGNSMHNHTMNSSGFGDAKITALYSLVKKSNSQFLLSLGLSIPTGNINLKGKSNSMMYPNERYPYNMQLGSGTFDLMPCISYLTQKNKWFFSSQLLSTIRTSNNSVGYRYGNDLTFNSWTAWQWLSFISSSLRIESSISEKITGIDTTLNQFTEISANTSNYGGKKIYGYLGSCVQPQKGFLKNTKLSFEYGLPLYQNVNGIQMKQTHNLNLAFNLIF